MIRRTLSSKDQVTIPKAIREQLGVKAHQAIDFQKYHDQIIIKPARSSNHQEQIKQFWRKINEITQKYGSDDTNYNWGKDVGAEKIDH